MKITLNQILDERKISQNQLAKDTGISTTTLRNLNHNRTTRISFDVLEKICPLSARMVVNQVSMKMENERISQIIREIRTVL